MPRIYDYIQSGDFNAAIALLLANINTRAFSGGTLAAKATGDPDLKTTTTIYYAINGILGIKAATATIDISTLVTPVAMTAAGTWTQAAAKYAAYLLTWDGSVFDFLKGLDAASSVLALKGLPAPAANKCPVGMVVVTNTTNPFIFGTTNSDAAGVTFTCSDISQVVNGLGSWYADTIVQ